jgi:hypothetical protein
MSNTYKFEEFEAKLLVWALRDIEFFNRNHPYMRFDYFEVVYHRDIYEIAEAYMKKYSQVIPRDVMRLEIEKMFYDRKRQDCTLDDYFEYFDALLQEPLTGEQYTEDEVIEFAKKQELYAATHCLVDGIATGQPRDQLIDEFNARSQKIKEIGQDKTDEGGAGMFEIIGRKVEEPEYLIKPFMKPGEKGYLTAGYKVGKTFLEILAMLCLSKGIPFLGFEVPKPRKVLYVRFELTEYEFTRRLQQMIKWEYKSQILKEPWCIHQKGFDLTSKNGKDLERLFHWIDEHEPDLLIFDPLYKLTSLNLAEPKSAIPLLRAYEKIQKKYPTLAIQFAHHMVKMTGDKRNSDSWDSSYGPMQFFADMDYEMRLRKIPVDEGEPKRFTLDFLTNAAPVDKMELERDEDTLIYRVVTESKLQKKMTLDDHNLKAMDRMLKALGKINQTNFKKSCKVELNMGRDLFDRLVKLGEDTLGWKVSREGIHVFYEINEPCESLSETQETHTSPSI